MMRLRAKSSGILLFATAAFVTGAIIAPARHRAKSGTSTETQPPTAAQLVTIIDGTLQPRFQQDAGIFGMSRIYGVDVIGWHQNVLNKGSRFREASANAPITKDVGREYIIGFLHLTKMSGEYVRDANGHPLRLVNGFAPPVYREMVWQQTRQQEKARKAGAEGTPRFHADHKALQDTAQSVCLNALPDVKQGRSCDVTRNGYLIAIRPVKAAKASCLPCHAGAKLNDALGAIVYTIRLDTAVKKLTARAF